MLKASICRICIYRFECDALYYDNFRISEMPISESEF